jgi:hypothetical protein
MEEHVEKKMKVDGETEAEVKQEPKVLEDMLKRLLVSQQEVVELFIEIFKRLEKPGIKELWS